MNADDHEVQKLERRADQLQHQLDGLREDLQGLRYIRGPKNGSPVRENHEHDGLVAGPDDRAGLGVLGGLSMARWSVAAKAGKPATKGKPDFERCPDCKTVRRKGRT